MKKAIKRLCILSAFLFVIQSSFLVGNAVESSVYISNGNSLLLASDGGLQARMDTVTGNISLETGGGKVFSVLPTGIDSDEKAAGNVKNEMRSVLMVQFADEDNTKFWTNSFISCVKRDTVTVKSDGKQRSTVIYDFSREKDNFEIPVIFSVEKGVFSAEIDFKNLREKGKNKILSVRLFPYFLSGTSTEQGYVIVPDGSGMAVSFNAETKGKIELPVYGENPTLTKRTQIGAQQKVYVPLIGMVKGDTAVAAYAVEGDCDASVFCQAAGTENNSTSVCFEFKYRYIDVTVLADNAWNEREIYKISEQHNTVNPVVRFEFLENTKAQPAGIAAVYREYLIQEKNLKIQPTSLQGIFEVFGAVQKQKHFLGIPYQGMVTATKLSDVSEMIQTVFDSGCNNTQWNLYGFLKGGMYNSDNDSFRIERAVGSKSDYRQLCADAEQNNADIILSSSVQHVYRAGLFEKRNTCKKISGDYAYQYFYKKNLNSANKDFSWLLLKPNLLLKKTEKLIKDYLHYGGDGLLLSDVGDELYSDYGEKYSSRNDTAELQIKQLDYVKQKTKNVWIDGASAYLTSHVNGIVNAPCESSHYDIQSFELPLFSMIFHGVLPITYTPVNTDESIIQVRMLKCLETGTVPYFRLTANSPQIYADTKLEFLLNTSFKRWQEKCTDFCNTYVSVCGELTDKVIVGYEIIGDVRKVTYSDGSIVYANYASTQQTINDITIDALSIEKR